MIYLVLVRVFTDLGGTGMKTMGNDSWELLIYATLAEINTPKILPCLPNHDNHHQFKA